MLTKIVWNIGEKSKKEKESFTSEGTNWVFSFDGHDSTFPIAMYVCLDTLFYSSLVF